MRVLLLGSSGMVGQGVLLECLRSDAITEVVAVTREPLTQTSPKLRESRRSDFLDWRDDDLTGFDTCFFCLGISSVGKTEEAYHRVTYDMTLALANPLLKASPQASFLFISGSGADSTERGRVMWARVKGAAENALLAMPFRSVYILRPGYIQPLHGVRSKVGWYNAIYSAVGWAYPLLHRLTPAAFTSTEAVGRAMIALAPGGSPNRILDNRAINAAAGM